MKANIFLHNSCGCENAKSVFKYTLLIDVFIKVRLPQDIFMQSEAVKIEIKFQMNFCLEISIHILCVCFG